MKRIYSLFIAISAFFWANAQGDLTVFSEDGDQFYLVINGERFNQAPETNVKAKGIMQEFVKAKVIFADGNLGEISSNVPIERGNEVTMMVKKNKKGEYKLAWRGTAPINSMGSVPPPPAAQGMRPLPPPPPQPMPATGATVTTQTTTTRTTMDVNPMGMPSVGMGATINDGGDNVSVGVNVGGMGMGATINDGADNVSVGVNVGGMGMGATVNESHTTTTTTVITNGSYPSQPLPPPPPAYQPAPTGCYAMDPSSYQAALASISKNSFEETKLKLAKQVLNSNCMTSAQVRGIMSSFTFEGSKLDFAKFAYPKVVDPQNYFTVSDVFEFESSTEELSRFTGN